LQRESRLLRERKKMLGKVAMAVNLKITPDSILSTSEIPIS
jgi:hypothetical protein